MRSLLVVLIAAAACSDSDPDPVVDPDAAGLATTCPADEAELVRGAACATIPELSCLHFGSNYCGSGFGGLMRCSCIDGAWACEDTYPRDGDVCDWPAGSFCMREGNPSCVTQPISGYCSCANGVWTCDEYCWEICPEHWNASWTTNPPPCAHDGQHCDLPDAHACDCTAGHYACQ